MSNLFNKVREFVKNSFNDEAQLLHFDRTVYWVQQLKPDADEALLIASISHDIERAFRVDKLDFENNEKKFTDEARLVYHQTKGANIMGNFLKTNNANPELIEKVKDLISVHEIGGDEDQNILKDADSLSFLENNADIFLSRLEKLGYDKVKEKFDWMYERITSSKAKELGKPFYRDMLEKLEKAK